MMAKSEFLKGLDEEGRKGLIRRLWERQSGKCFICQKDIDLALQADDLDIDHIVPRAAQGPDEENNFAVTHAHCNRSKGASDLRTARRMAEFEQLQAEAKGRGERGANLGHLLQKHADARAMLKLRQADGRAEFVLSDVGQTEVQSSRIYRDRLSGMDYFFALLPLEYLHHDDRINPRSIGSNIRGLIDEFLRGRPQLHVALGWWSPQADGAGPVKVFDGQHKAAAQILLGAKELPVRIFIEPDTNVLLQTNTNAGGPLRQVAFDTAVMRHLGSTLFAERVRQYKNMKGLREDDYGFSEKDLVTFFRGEHRAMLRYILDASRDSITQNQENRLMEFVEWSGKSAERPLAYAAIERTFFREFLYKKSLETPLDEGMETGENPRAIEKSQMVRLMSMFADVFFVGQWDPETGGRRIENRLQKGDPVDEKHLRAWRIAREEILANVLRWVRAVIENYYAFTGKPAQKEKILQKSLPDELWARIEKFLRRLSDLPCWVDKGLSNTVFGVKQNLDYWETIFDTGKAPTGVPVLARPLDIKEMIIES